MGLSHLPESDKVKILRDIIVFENHESELIERTVDVSQWLLPSVEREKVEARPIKDEHRSESHGSEATNSYVDTGGSNGYVASYAPSCRT